MNTIELARSRGLNITLEDSEKCPDCGGNCWDVFYVEEWGRSYCDECLDRQIEKFTLPSAALNNNPATNTNQL